MKVATCEICRFTDPSVKVAMIRWRDGKDRFGAGSRCPDIDRCWARVVDSGQPWEVADDRPERRAT